MSVSDWSKKQASDALLAHTPSGLRQQMKQVHAPESKKPRSAFDIMRETTLAGQVAVSPRPMQVSTVPGVEVSQNLGNSAETSPGSDDGHTHIAYYDDAGNGYTDEVDGHMHTVRSFMVAPYQDPGGSGAHQHTGTLPRTGATDNKQMDYRGNP